MPDSQFVGVDGCPAGWFSVGLDSNENYELKTFSRFDNLLKHYKSAQLILVDIPIGLPDGGEERCCDKQARKLLNQSGHGRGSTVFPTPVRAVIKYYQDFSCCGDIIEAVQCHLYQVMKAMPYKQLKPDIAQDARRQIARQIRHAVARSIQRQVTGKSLSAQTLAIADKIAEVDVLLPRPDGPRVRETHPEICFFALNNGRPMLHRKRKTEGKKERLDALHRVEKKSKHIVEDGRVSLSGKGVGRTDVIDALAAAVTAKRGWLSQFETLPKQSRCDSKNLPMEIVYWQPGNGHC